MHYLLRQFIVAEGYYEDEIMVGEDLDKNWMFSSLSLYENKSAFQHENLNDLL